MTNTIISNYNNPNIATISAARSLVQQAQSKFAASNTTYQGHVNRGSDALAGILGDLYVAIETLLASTTPEIQAHILLTHHVKPAAGGTSTFSPWIKVATGRPKPNGKMKMAADGVRYPEWEPYRSFEKYFHVMEELRDQKVLSDHAGHIKRAGGAMAIVEARQKRLKEDGVAGRKATAEEQRTLLLSDGDAIPFKLAFELPVDAGDFFTIVCKRVLGSDPVMLGVVRANADRDLTALAASKFDALRKARAERKAEQARREAAEEAARVASEKAERNFMLVMLNPEKLAAMKAEAERRHKAGELLSGSVG